MRFAWLVCLIVLVNLSPASAQNKPEDLIAAEKDSIFFEKYGQKGLDQFNRFLTMAKYGEKPVSKKTDQYKIKHPEIKTGFSKSMPTNMPAPVNKQCAKDGEISLESQVTKELYNIAYKGKSYKLRMETVNCSGGLYNIKNRTLRLPNDADGYSYSHFYRDNKKLFSIKGIEKYAIFQDKLVASVSEGCCNMDSSFSYYDWVTGKTLGTDLLHTSLDDADSVEMDLGDIAGEDGQPMFSQKEVAEDRRKTKATLFQNYQREVAQKFATPIAVESSSYKTKRAFDYEGNNKISKPADYNNKNINCEREGKISLDGTLIKEFYQLPYKGKMYNIRVERQTCSSQLYDLKSQVVYDGEKNTSTKQLQLYSDDKKVLTLESVEDYYLYGPLIIVKPSMQEGGPLDYYNWITGKTIAKEVPAKNLNDGDRALKEYLKQNISMKSKQNGDRYD